MQYLSGRAAVSGGVNSPKRNLLLTICYDGSRYHGWQVQKNALAVQEVFQRELERILGGPHDIKGCSRTDTGVHALQYCVSVATENRIPPQRLTAALNRLLPKDIPGLGCREVEDGFHARYSCTGKEYLYKIWNSPVRNPFLEGYALHYPYSLDHPLLHSAAQSFIGTHDFSGFCSAGSKVEDTVRTVRLCEVSREGELVVLRIQADGFLYNMVRIITGTLLRIAQGKINPESLPEIIASKDRTKAGPTAPACGLYLNRVFYDGLSRTNDGP